MVTLNALFRTFRIQCGHVTGTCFALDVDKKQYLVTARHVTNSVQFPGEIAIFRKGQWNPYNAALVGEGQGDIDITVLALNTRISAADPLPSTVGQMSIGQDMYFLGFPYGKFTVTTFKDNDYPMAWVKKGILSSTDVDENDVLRVYLDGHNNPGFSGGPVVFSKVGTPRLEYYVCAVVSGYLHMNEPIYADDLKTPLTYRYNTGIVLAYGIRHALDLIRRNPIGFPLQAA